jgi:L-ascorbate metabolism protein UlaG (beta-lactamase superfamily)
MLLRRLDDYQSWAWEFGAAGRILVDPWLTDEMSLAPGHWLFGRRRMAPQPVTSWLPVAALVLTSHFSDHLHPKTLQQVPRDTPCFAPPAAAAHLRKLGFLRVQRMTAGDRFELVDGVMLTAVAPAFPFARSAVGYLVEHRGAKLYFETHAIDVHRVEAVIGRLDVLVAPVQGVRVAGVPFTMSPARALAAAKRLKPSVWVPTGIDPQLAHGLFSATLLFYRGAVKSFAAALAETPTRWVQPAVGESVDVGTLS